MPAKSYQDYAVVVIQIINQARKEGYDPRTIADAIHAVCLPSTAPRNWGIIGEIRTTALALCAEFAQHTMDVEARKGASNVQRIR